MAIVPEKPETIMDADGWVCGDRYPHPKPEMVRETATEQEWVCRSCGSRWWFELPDE